jgi:predicted  nucleic acid-binding Zn-ribbon protein
MESLLIVLKDLQNEDLEVLSLRENLEALRRNIEKCHEDCSRYRDDLVKIGENLDFYETQKSIQENDLKLKQEEIDALSLQLKDVKNNKEYTAFNAQIKLKKLEKGTIEDKLLQILDALEKTNLQKESLQKRIEDTGSKVQDLEKDIFEEVGQIEEAIREHEKKRDELTEHLEEDLKREYERLFDRFAGEALCAVFDKTCSGCCMTLSAQIENALRLGKDIVRCPNCQRLLFMEKAP